MPDVRQFIVDATDAGRRLDVFLAHASGLSRARVQNLIERGAVLVGSHPQKPRHVLRTGERVTMTVPDPEPLALTPEPIPLDILYEDEDLLVLNKPAGLVVHPGAGRATGTLVHALLAHCRDLQGIGGVERPGIVHRLDRETSGVMVVAKSETAHWCTVRCDRRRDGSRRRSGGGSTTGNGWVCAPAAVEKPAPPIASCAVSRT
jgi:23S rRNA pseudouridine1911/1915/1917 synthase